MHLPVGGKRQGASGIVEAQIFDFGLGLLGICQDYLDRCQADVAQIHSEERHAALVRPLIRLRAHIEDIKAPMVGVPQIRRHRVE
jgi:hypothetical protein